jgi:hypothetical protein
LPKPRFDDADEDDHTMAKYVPYLSEDEIERDAAALLAEFARARRVPIEPPVPIEDIVEKYLKLGIEFDDTHRLFGVPRGPGGEADILGAIFFRRLPDRNRPMPRPGGKFF